MRSDKYGAVQGYSESKEEGISRGLLLGRSVDLGI